MRLEHLLSDVRYGLRALGRAPGFTSVAALTLALGIGANTAMFSILYGILLRPLPYQDAQRLVLIQREQDLAGTHRSITAFFLSVSDIEAWQKRLTSFQSTAVYSIEVAALSTSQGTDVIDSAVVSGTFFSTLSIPMIDGRPLGEADEGVPTVVISERLAERLFGGESAIGRSVNLSSRSYTIAGVADSRLQFPSPKTDVWIPAGYMRSANARCCAFRMFGRLHPNVTVTQAGAEVDATAKALTSAAVGSRANTRATVVRLRDQIVGSVRSALLVLFAAVALVLLVACANVVNLLLARHVTRRREAAIRSALGATRQRLVSQTMVESALLTLIGSAIGVGLAIATVRLLIAWQPPGVPRLDAVRVDTPVLLFSIGLSAIAAFAAGLLPAWQSSNTAEALKLGAATVGSAPAGRRIRRVLSAAQLSISLVLLVGATLLGRSLVRLMQTDLGVTTDHVVTASMNLAFGGRPTDAQTLVRVERVIERLQALPGVRAVGAGTALPPNRSRLMLTLRRAGEAIDYQAAGVAATPDYCRALGMRLVSGRFFTDADDASHPDVMIMSVDTARRFFGNGDPIGRTLSLPLNRNGVNSRVDMTLVGIIANVKYSGLDAAADDAVYRPFKQQTWVAPYLVVRTAGDPQLLVPTVRREIGNIDRGIVVSDVRALEGIVSDAAAQPRFRTMLLASMAALALLMAVIGLYGVVAYSVAQRTREIGIRMALGARRHDVLAMVLREGLMLAAAGIATGLLLAVLAVRALTGLLYGVASTDAMSFAASAVSLLIVAFFASYIPARRATKVDPLIALRSE